MTLATRPHTHRTLRLVAWLLLAIALVPLLLAVRVSAQATDAVTVSNQPLANKTVTVAKVTAAKAGWIVIHLDEGGNPGKVLGQTAVKAGDNANVAVTLSQDVPVNGGLWAMLHIDAGTIGTYEFPGPDAPVLLNQQIVMTKFQIAAGPGASTPPSPNALPDTGAAVLPEVWLLALAIAVLLLGAYLTRRGAEE